MLEEENPNDASDETPVAEDETNEASGDAVDEGETAGEPADVASETVLAISADWLDRELDSAPDPIEPGPANPSADGKTLAYLQVDQDGQVKLWLCPVDGGAINGIALPCEPLFDEEGPQWSPDGRTIAFVGRRTGGGDAIWLLDVESSACRLLSRQEASESDPRWSPDGSLIAFVMWRDGNAAICITAADGEGIVQQLTNPLAGQTDVNPTWSHDGNRIGFRRIGTEGDSAGDHIWTVVLATGEMKQATKKLGNRRNLMWMAGREQMAYVSEETEWDNIAVVNPDNQSSWNLASESGDKSDPRFSPDGARMLYSRTLHGSTRLCERGTSGASADTMDPGDGAASAGRWMPEKQIVYRFTPADGETRYIVQAAKKDAERQQIFPAVAWEAPAGLVNPSHIEMETGGGLKLGGWLYRPAGDAGARPAVLYLGDAPHRLQSSGYRPVEQSLAAAGFVVLAPSLAGTPGYGKKITSAMSKSTVPEAEVSDLLDILGSLRGLEGVDGSRIAIAGSGYGAGLALLLVGSRPGNVNAVAAIDPAIDLSAEFAAGDAAWRAWQLKNFGLPVANRARMTMRSPLTFAGTIAAPVLLLGTDGLGGAREAQLTGFADVLNAAGIVFERQAAGGESRWDQANRLTRFLRQALAP